MTVSQVFSLAIIAVAIVLTVLNVRAARRLSRRPLPRLMGIHHMSDDELAHIVAQIVVECHRRQVARAEVAYLEQKWEQS